MSRLIVHLSDLHFGRIDPATLDPLVESVRQLRPDLVAVSGDLTQRARRHEFIEAREFLERLPFPKLVVPGNHDVPLENPYLRFVSKWSRFREYIEPQSEPSHIDDEIAVIGVNTGRALTWKGGRIGIPQIEMVRQRFCSVRAGALKILVVHHPLDIPSGWGMSNRSMRSERAFESWRKCGVDVILAGHVHKAYAGSGEHYAVIVQAGTATSTRGRGEPNSFNLIRVEAAEFVVARQAWREDNGRFETAEETHFQRPESMLE